MKCKYGFKICILLCFSVVIFSCNKYKEILPDVEKIKIIIYIDWERNNKDHFVEILDKAEIKIISKYISNIPSPLYKCGYNGQIEFFSKNNNLLLEAEFNTDCNTIVFVYDDKLYHRRISSNGLEYINKIIEEIEQKNIEN
jgi:hypothetical protein